METEHIPNKHLTYEERNFIEVGLNNGRNFAEIAKDLNKDRRTISRKTPKHKSYICKSSRWNNIFKSNDV